MHGEIVGLTVSDEIYAMLISKNVPIERAEMEEFRCMRNESVHGTIKTDDFAERSQLYQKFYNIS